jgi:hypothetical protein
VFPVSSQMVCHMCWNWTEADSYILTNAQIEEALETLRRQPNG